MLFFSISADHTMKCHVTQYIKETEGNTRIFLGSGWSYKSNGFMNSGKYQHVFTDPTSKLHSAGDMVAIMEVLVRPPSESCNILVNLLSLFVQKGSNHQQGLHTRDTLLPHPIKWFGLFKVRKKQLPPKREEK